MAAHLPILRPLASVRPTSSFLSLSQPVVRSLTTKWTPRPKPQPLPKKLPAAYWSQLPERMRPQPRKLFLLSDSTAIDNSIEIICFLKGAMTLTRLHNRKKKMESRATARIDIDEVQHPR
jgi:hypothetical protein